MRQLTPINHNGLENVNARQFNVNKFLEYHFLNSSKGIKLSETIEHIMSDNVFGLRDHM